MKIFLIFYLIFYVLNTSSYFCADFVSFKYNLSVPIYCSDRNLPNLRFCPCYFCLFYTLSRLIKPGDITKECSQKAIQFHGNFHGLKLQKATGPDGIPIKILRHPSNTIEPVIIQQNQKQH